MPLTATEKRDLQLVQDVDSTDATFTTLANLDEEPSGDGVLEVPGGYGTGPSLLYLEAVAVAADNIAFKVRVFGWRKSSDDSTWRFILLAELTVTTCAIVGVAATLIDETHRSCDTYVIAKGSAGVDVSVESPADDTSSGHALIDLKGCSHVSVKFSKNSATVTGMNAGVSFL